PDWVLLNHGGLGYYRAEYQPAQLRRLLRGIEDRLSPAEELALLDDLIGSFESGGLAGDSFLDDLGVLGASGSREVASHSASIARELSDRLLPSELFPPYGRYIQQLYGARARRLGWTPSPDESEDAALERQVFVPLVADRGRDRNFE